MESAEFALPNPLSVRRVRPELVILWRDKQGGSAEWSVKQDERISLGL